MWPKIIISFLLIFLLNTTLHSQVKTDYYKTIVYKIYGDLNKDNLDDMVVVKENNTDKHNPYLLEIFFQNKSGSFQNVFSSTKAVMEKFPYGDERTEVILEGLQIKNGVLIFRNQLLKGNFTHKFRYQNGEFELIGYTFNNASAGYMEHMDYNLSTGDKTEKHTAYETDKILKLAKTKNKLSVLPNLKDFSPLEFTY
jgi:hypothetical protein